MKHIPFKNAFEKAKLSDKLAKVILWISTAILLTAFILDKIDNDFEIISSILNSINCFFIIGYVILNFITDFYFFNSSIQKREDFIDNSFGTSFSEEKSHNYFTNDNLNSGIYKMGVNCLENTLFTYNISKAMIPKIVVQSTILFLLFLGLALSGMNNTIVLFIHLSLPFIIFIQAFRHVLFVNRMNKVYENFRRLFNSMKSIDVKTQKLPNIIHDVIEYESLLSWGRILLCSKLYNNMNPDLSEKWERIKVDYKIEN